MNRFRLYTFPNGYWDVFFDIDTLGGLRCIMNLDNCFIYCTGGCWYEGYRLL